LIRQVLSVQEQPLPSFLEPLEQAPQKYRNTSNKRELRESRAQGSHLVTSSVRTFPGMDPVGCCAGLPIVVLPDNNDGHPFYLTVRLDAYEVHPTRKATPVKIDFV